MKRQVDAATLKAWLGDGAEIALFDVREHGQYGESHLFYAVPLPYSRLEPELLRLVPRTSTRVVLYDDGSLRVAELAARRSEALGYSNVHVLEGGTAAWKARGYELFAGVNVPSKAFGELVEEACHTPRVSAAELQKMVERGEDLVIVDGRPLTEYRKMNIPGGRCCPNGELALRIGAIAPDPKTKVVVNCAGRTRSIIGAQTLLNFGIANPVYALENGTQGWFLAGLELERGASRSYPPAPGGEALERLQRRAGELAARFFIPHVSSGEVDAWLADEARTTYLLDVRTPEEFAAGSLPGAQHAPGGQLVQGTDAWVGVRGARIVLFDADGVRAVLAAMWLRQMGHDAYVLQDGIKAQLERASNVKSPLHALPEAEANILSREKSRVVDLRPSAAYRKGHLPGSTWSIRPLLRNSRFENQTIILVADEPAIAQAAAIDLAELGAKDIRFLPGARLEGMALESTPDRPTDAERIDHLFFTAGRHEGQREEAIKYLTWEVNLLKQLDPTERAAFKILH